MSDENRYLRAVKGVAALAGGHVGEAMEFLTVNEAHQLLPLAALVPAAVHEAAVLTAGWPMLDYRLPAAILSLWSVAVIALMYPLARRAGADETEALFAVVLAACANTLFYYSRHLFPYDASLALGLLALWFGMKRESGFRRSVAVGLLVGACVLVYNAYYTLAAVAGLVHLASGWPSGKRMMGRCLGLLSGVLLAFSIPFSIAFGRGVNLLEGIKGFSRTITQGAYSEGWQLPLAYLWHAESIVAVAWGLAVVTALFLACHRAPGATRAGLWVGIAGALYAVLAILSTCMNVFVVSGRWVRPIVPFLCLATAFTLRTLLRYGRLGQIGVAAVWLTVVSAAILNFRTPLTLVFPQQVRDIACRQYGVVQERSTCATSLHRRWWLVEHPDVPALDSIVRKTPGLFRSAVQANIRKVKSELLAASADVDAPSRYVLFNAEMFYTDVPVPCTSPSKGVVLNYWEHPLKYIPYQYEGWTPAVRAWFRTLDYRMILVRLADQE